MRILIYVGRLILRTLLTILIIVLILFFLIQTPFVQDFVRGKAEHYLSGKLKTRIRIGHLNVSFFHSVTLKGVYIEDRNRDTLLSAGLIDVHLRMLGLLNRHLEIEDIRLQDLTAKVLRQPADSVFNYQFIIDAFSGNAAAKPAKPKGSPMVISLGRLVLDRVRLVYADSAAGNYASIDIGQDRTTFAGLDPDHLRFECPDLDLQNTVLRYRDRTFSTSMGFRLLHAGNLSLDCQRLIFRTGQLRLDSAGYAMDIGRAPRQRTVVDYSHLLVSDLNLRGEELDYSPDSVSGSIVSCEFTEQSGFRLNRLKTRFFYSDKRISLEDLVCQTPGTLLQRSAALRCDSLAGLLKNPAHTRIDLDLAGSRVQLKDILFFAPQLRTQPVFRRPGDTWQLNARLRGTFDALAVQTLQCSGPGSLRLDASGRIAHVFDVRRLFADIQVRRLSGTPKDLQDILPPNTLPSNIAIPARFGLNGRLAGGVDELNTEMVLQSTSGGVHIKGFVRHLRSVMGIEYDCDLKTSALDLGAILRDSLQLGAVTGDFSVHGKGRDVHSANAQVRCNVISAVVRQHTWHRLELEGSIAGQHAVLHSTIDDRPVHFELHAAADFNRKFPALQLDWRIDTLDLHAIGLTTDTIQFKGHLVAGFADTDPDSLQGTLRLTDVDLLLGGQRIATDSVILAATHQGNSEDIHLQSDPADLHLAGRYKLTELSKALQHTINRYYPLDGSRDTVSQTLANGRDSLNSKQQIPGAFSPQDWTLRLTVRATPLVLRFLPSLSGSDSLGGVLAYHSDQDDLHLSLGTPRIVMGTQYFHSVHIDAATADGRLLYGVSVADAHGSGFELYRTSLTGELRDKRLTTVLLLKDSKGVDRYRIGGMLEKTNDDVRLSLDPDSLLLNYEAWQVSRDNFIQYNKEGLLVHDLAISHKQDSLIVNSKNASPTSPIDVRFAGFRISTLTHLAEQDSLLVDGTLDGHAEVRDVMSKPAFTSDLKITGLAYKADTVGDLAVKVSNSNGNTLFADIALEGRDNDVRVKGEYYTSDSRINMNLELGRLNLAAFGDIAKEEVEKMKGYLRGQFTITGAISKPLLKGSLYFDSTLITPAVSGEPLKVSGNKIDFDEDGFNFSQFSLLDSAGNKLVIDGNVFTKDYRDFGFDLSFNAVNFRLVNAAQASNKEFYGQLNLDAAINLEGKMASLKADGDIRVNRRTNFFFVLPTSNPEVVDREGVVRFIDKDHPGDTLTDRAAIELHANQTDIKGMDVSMNIQTDSNALFTIVIDERNGDALNIRGRSNLVFGMNRSGKMDLTGSYEVQSGSYNLSLDVLKRKFDIQRGSIITWTGDPTTATLNMTATYTAVTASIDLVANQIAGRSQSDQNKFKEKLPFLVTLKMEGELMKPKITFDIALPQNIITLWPDVDARLQQIRQEESELNKQVFALLLLNRFVGEDPLASQAGGGSSIGSMAFQSASQILTNQMDQLAASLIKGVDIHFNVNNEQDYSTGNEINYTELNVTLAKNLNERIQVSVGSNFDILGTGAPNQNASTLAGDVAVNYKLSRDGRYMLRAYRQNQYEAVVEGQVVETGLSFILTFDYNRFKELFRRSKEERLQERAITKPSKTSTP